MSFDEFFFGRYLIIIWRANLVFVLKDNFVVKVFVLRVILVFANESLFVSPRGFVIICKDLN